MIGIPSSVKTTSIPNISVNSSKPVTVDNSPTFQLYNTNSNFNASIMPFKDISQRLSMDTGWIGSIAGAAAGLVGSGLSYASQQKQLQFEKDLARYNRNLQNQMFQREDTAVQRRRLDLMAAGMSPVLAAGQGAGTGPTVQVNAPTAPNFDMSGAAELAMGAMRMDAEISKTAAETEAILQQKRKAEAETSLTLAHAATAWHDRNVQKESGVPSGSGLAGKVINDLTGVKMNLEKRIMNTVDAVKKGQWKNLFNIQ